MSVVPAGFPHTRPAGVLRICPSDAAVVIAVSTGRGDLELAPSPAPTPPPPRGSRPRAHPHTGGWHGSRCRGLGWLAALARSAQGGMVADDSPDVEIVAAPSHEPRVLVAEDQALARWALGQALARVGFQVVAVEDRERACGQLYTTRFDAVVMSGSLAGQDMTDVLEGLARFQPETRLIVLCEDDGLAGRMARIPGAIVLLKPFEMRALLAAVLGAGDEPHLLSA